MQKTCPGCGQSFTVAQDDLDFYQKISPVFGGKTYLIPPPTLCPFCRMQRRQAFRNDRSLYQSQSALSGKPLLSMYEPANQFVIYDQHEWWSDTWDPLVFGRAIDLSRPFFAQFRELQQIVPRFNVFNRESENCDFVNYAPHCKNCYLIFGAWFNEDCLYGQTLNECRSCFDNLFLNKSELCYENIDGNNNYHALFCHNCTESVDSWFCYDCKGIKNCIGCWNLRNKEYYVWNEPVSNDIYEETRRQFASHAALTAFRDKWREAVVQRAIHRAFTGFQNENCTGDFLFQCKNAKLCFSAYSSQDIAYSCRVFDMKNSLDFEGGGKGELVYEGMSNDFSYHSIGCMTCEYMKNAHYCDLCFNCTDCFGCIGLRQQRNCVFNRQYDKDTYETLVGKIIELMQKSKEWGEFYPIALSPFCYNETLAQEYFPLTKEQTLAKGFRWKDIIHERPAVSSILSAESLPDRIGEVNDAILQSAITCQATGRPFKITKRELQFYRDEYLPLPRLHPDERHRRRMLRRNPRRLWRRTCAKCGAEIQTTFAPERPEIVYCERCYLKAVY